jgi:hypothetical protein
MLEVVEYIVNILSNNADIQGYVGTRIFPTGVDITPEAPDLFPLITFHSISEITRTVPRGAREAIIQIDVWSILSQLQVEEISEKIISILNFIQFRDGTCLRWNREDGAVDLTESDRRIWRKSLRFRYWAK